MNFKQKYCADMGYIQPGEQLVASTKKLLAAQPARRGWGYRTAAALSAAVLTLAIAVPLMLPGKTVDEPAALNLPETDSTTMAASLYGQDADLPENASIERAMPEAVDSGKQMEDKLTEDWEITACRAYTPGQSLTATELAEQTEFADFLPQELPTGLTLETATLFEEDSAKRLFVDWTDWQNGGYDYLTLTVRDFYTADEARLVDIDEPATWDLSLYEIPLADSVPSELWQQVDCPIFQPADFTAEVLAKRAAASDQNAKYIRFGLKFGDTLLEYTAHTADIDGVWQAISSTLAFALRCY